MHPIEHLRYIARVGGVEPALIARDAALALANMARMEPAGLVPACRRLVDAHVESGPVWWLSARVLGSDDPASAAETAALELESDPTASHLADALPDDATALVVGWPETCARALRSRGDIEVLVVDSMGQGLNLARMLSDYEQESAATLVPESGVGAAAAVADLVLLEASAAGPSGVLAAPLSEAAAAVAAHRMAPVWAVAGVGRVLPERLWDALLARLDSSGSEPWDRPAEVVPSSLLTQLIGPAGITAAGEGLCSATCPAAPELFRQAG